ncbi:MAG TPA: 2-amino-4-hydroxy-6-hydroxymethyldihydropteridine diphosphokinase [Terriglobia bacterium]|nr:2-amino-4-hydroxy-6-hydroxymethyldihydropteridine diphosphokinase [Terriglobia bacterium]
MKRVYLSLGSNVGDRIERLQNALQGLAEDGIQVRRVSSFYKTEPVDFQPQAWFANCVAETETDLMPMQLLRACQRVERALGRRRGVAKGPRPIDIDILLYENIVVRSRELNIPHPRMEERRFVLIPLRELAPSLHHPVSQRTVQEMLHDTRDTSQVIRMRS